MKRLLAVVLGALGITAWLRRRRHVELEPSPADELRAKLAATKEPDAEPEHEAEPGVDARRADVHARARAALDDLKE